MDRNDLSVVRENEAYAGATILVVAASLIALMGVAALVVDGGLGFNERRQAQSAADFSVLAALQFATSCGTSCNIGDAVDNGAAEAQNVVAGNLPGRTLDWLACTRSQPSRRIHTSQFADRLHFIHFQYRQGTRCLAG